MSQSIKHIRYICKFRKNSVPDPDTLNPNPEPDPEQGILFNPDPDPACAESGTNPNSDPFLIKTVIYTKVIQAFQTWLVSFFIFFSLACLDPDPKHRKKNNYFEDLRTRPREF